MKSITKPGTILLWDGKPVEVIGILGERSIAMRYLRQADMPKCEHCGEPLNHEFVIIEASPVFQFRSMPVNTLETT